jgi:hypothetical protein
VVLEDDFEPDLSAPTWDFIAGGSVGNACGVHGGSKALTFSSTSDRRAETNAIDLSGGGEISFWLVTGSVEGGACDRPEAGEGEDIKLLYSLDGELFFQWATYPVENFRSWKRVQVPIAAGSTLSKPEIHLRWTQSNAAEGKDAWALDDVAVVAQSVVPRTAKADLAFVGTAYLPVFPCRATPTTVCTGGSFQADFLGTITGTYGAVPYEIVLSTTNKPLLGSFSYRETVCDTTGLGGLVLGEAWGSGSMAVSGTGLKGTWGGGDAGGTVIQSVSLTFDFHWVREGTTAVILVERMSVTIGLPHLPARKILEDHSFEATAAFVPVGSSVPTCNNPSQGLSGTFLGEAAFAYADASTSEGASPNPNPNPGGACRELPDPSAMEGVMPMMLAVCLPNDD